MRSNRGLTFIEVLIIIAILAILVAIIVPAYNDVQQKHDLRNITFTLVCVDADGKEVKRVPAIPGERWDVQGGMYITYDVNGNPTTTMAAGDSCKIERS